MNVLRAVETRFRCPSWRKLSIVGLAGLAIALYLLATFTSGADLSEQLPFPLLFLALGIYELVSGKRRLNRCPVVGWLLLALTVFLLGAKLHKAWHAGWNNGPTGWYSIAGFLPVDDALKDVQGARSLLEHGVLDEFSARRPMVANYHALMLWATRHNVVFVLLINNLLLALSIAMFGYWIYARFGILAAVLAALLETYYIKPFAPTMMSEIPGLCFGNFAFLLLAQGALNNRQAPYLLGIGVLSAAFTLRAGAVFALPALVLAGGWIFARSRKFNLRFSALGIGALCLPVLLSMVELRAASPPGGRILYGQFSYALYGMVHGNKNWDYYKTAHPELLQVEDSRRSRIVYGLVRQELEKRPFALVSALARGYADASKDFFGRLYPMPFPMSLYPFLIPLLYLFAGLGMEKDESLRRLLVVLSAAVAGIFLSLPFLGSVASRVIAVTVPITSGVLAIGLKRMIQRLRATEGGAPADLSTAWLERGAAIVSLALLAATLCVPVAGKIHRAFLRGKIAGADAPAGTVPLRISKGSLLFVSSDDAPAHPASIRWSDLQKYGFEDQAIRTIQPGEWLASGVVGLQDDVHFYRFVIFEDSRLRNGVAYCRVEPIGDSTRVYRAHVVQYAADAR